MTTGGAFHCSVNSSIADSPSKDEQIGHETLPFVSYPWIHEIFNTVVAHHEFDWAGNSQKETARIRRLLMVVAQSANQPGRTCTSIWSAPKVPLDVGDLESFYARM